MWNRGQIQCEGLIEKYIYDAYYNWIAALYKDLREGKVDVIEIMIVIIKILSALIFSLKSDAHKTRPLSYNAGNFSPFPLTNLASCLSANKTGMCYCYDVEMVLPFLMTF